MSYIFGKLGHSAIIWPIGKPFECILRGVRVLLTQCNCVHWTQDLTPRLKNANRNPIFFGCPPCDTSCVLWHIMPTLWDDLSGHPSSIFVILTLLCSTCSHIHPLFNILCSHCSNPIWTPSDTCVCNMYGCIVEQKTKNLAKAFKSLFCCFPVW